MSVPFKVYHNATFFLDTVFIKYVGDIAFP